MPTASAKQCAAPLMIKAASKEVEVLQADCRAGKQSHSHRSSCADTEGVKCSVCLPIAKPLGTAPWRRGWSAVTRPAVVNGHHGPVSGDCRPAMLPSGLKAGRLLCLRTCCAVVVTWTPPPPCPNNVFTLPCCTACSLKDGVCRNTFKPQHARGRGILKWCRTW